MFWWDWTKKQCLLLIAAMLVIAATPWMLLGWLPEEPLAFVGGTSFLMIPQLLGLLLIIGMKTGRMPAPYGQVILREEAPILFWIGAAAYAAPLVCAVWAIFVVGADIAINGLE